MDDLIAFLNARLDEAAEVALRHDDPDCAHLYGCDLLSELGPECDCGEPARVLAEVDIKRRIIGLFDLDFNESGVPVFLGGYGKAYWDVVRLLAFQFDWHDDYQQGWKP